MRIAHVLASFHVGGGEMLALQLAARQKAAGHQVLAIGMDAGPLAKRFQDEGIEVHILPRPPLATVSRWPQMIRFLRSLHLDVVHTHNPPPLVYAIPAAKCVGSSTVHTKHGEQLEIGRREWLRRKAALFADAFVSVSASIDAFAREHNEAPTGRMLTIENGVDLSHYGPNAALRAEVRTELGLSENDWVVGAVGRQEGLKNHALLIRAMAPLFKQGFRLVLVGSGSQSERLRQLTQDLQCEAYVKLPGMRLDVPRLLTAFDVFAISSNTEGLPLTLIEAMATGLPVISTRVGAIPSIVEPDVHGVLVPVDDELAMRGAIERLASQREEAKRMGERGRALALEKFAIDQMAERYMRLYRSLLDR